MVGCQQGGEVGRMKEKAQGIRSINCKYKIGRGRLRIVWEMEKPKNLYVQPMDRREGLLEGAGVQGRGE